jgi:hypothetical protein
MTRKKLIHTLCFIVGLSLLLYALNKLLITGVQHAEHAQTGKISLLMNHSLDPQVMIFGASNGETGIDPLVLQQQTGKTVFNMSLDGTSIRQFGDLVKEFNDYSKNAGTIVFAIGPFAFQKEALPSSMNRYYAWIDNPYIRTNSFLNEVPEFRKLRYVPFYGFVLYDSDFYKSSVDGWSRILNHPVLGSTKAHQGWEPMAVQWGENNSVQAVETITLNVDSSVVSAYQSLVEKLNKKGRKAVFVLMPCHEEAMNHFVGYEKLRKAVYDLSATPNQYIDLSEDSISLDKKYFYNYTHLNVTGAEAFSKRLGEKMIP